MVHGLGPAFIGGDPKRGARGRALVQLRPPDDRRLGRAAGLAALPEQLDRALADSRAVGGQQWLKLIGCAKSNKEDKGRGDARVTPRRKVHCYLSDISTSSTRSRARGADGMGHDSPVDT